LRWLLSFWPFVFGVTLIAELLVLLAVLRRNFTPGRIALLALGVNLVTHPVIWFVLPRLFVHRTAYLLVAEAFAVITEAVLIWLLLGRRSPSLALLASALANAGSYAVGLLLLGVSTQMG
jgi:hypothetical protein